MNRWPDFFIAGAMRAGTTSLHYYLQAHPDVFMPEVKEPHFFAPVVQEDRNALVPRGLRVKVVKKERDYLKLFALAGSKQLAGESSVLYLFDADAPKRIKERLPQAKIVLSLRNPITRALSHYQTRVLAGVEKRSFYEAVTRDHALAIEDERRAQLYVELGLYQGGLKRFLESFGPSQVHVVLFEDLARSPQAVVQGLCEFLGVSYCEGRFFDPNRTYNPTGEPRNGFFRWVWRNQNLVMPLALRYPFLKRGFAAVRDKVVFGGSHNSRQGLDPEAVRFLWSVYEPDIAGTEALLNRSLAAWRGGVGSATKSA